MKYTPEQIQKKYESLPEDIKKAVSSVDTTDTIIDIGEKYKLHVDKLGKLLEKVTYVMLGLEKSSSFTETLKNELNISQELTNSLVKDINEQIFLKIRESLKEIDEEKNEEKKDFESFQKTPNKGFEKKPNIIKPEQKKVEEEKEIKKEDLLKEIEKPLNKKENFIDNKNNQQKFIEKKEKEDNFQKENIETKITQSILDENIEITNKLENKNLSTNVQKKPMRINKKDFFEEKKQLNILDEDNIVEDKLTKIVKEPLIKEKNEISESDDLKKTPALKVDPYREPIE